MKENIISSAFLPSLSFDEKSSKADVKLPEIEILFLSIPPFTFEE